VFRIPRVGTVAGCLVVRGAIRRGALARVRREGELVHEGRVASLRRFQEDVADVAQGHECGVAIAGLDEVRTGDTIEAYEIVRSDRPVHVDQLATSARSAST
jgi:translation initiation factor IF-2